METDSPGDTEIGSVGTVGSSFSGEVSGFFGAMVTTYNPANRALNNRDFWAKWAAKGGEPGIDPGVSQALAQALRSMNKEPDNAP
jgi:hypothetical protein